MGQDRNRQFWGESARARERTSRHIRRANRGLLMGTERETARPADGVPSRLSLHSEELTPSFNEPDTSTSPAWFAMGPGPVLP